MADEFKSLIKPFAEGMVKKPTPTQMGFTKRNFIWFPVELEGERAYSNGHILDVSEPNFRNWDKNRGSASAVLHTRWMDDAKLISVDSIMERARKNAQLVQPLGTYSFVGFDAILLAREDGKVACLRMAYYNYFATKYPNMELHQGAADAPFLVEHHGNDVGLVMPVRPDKSIKNWDVAKVKSIIERKGPGTTPNYGARSTEVHTAKGG